MTDLVWQVFAVALLTDLATGLGALPFAFVRQPSERWQGWMVSVAAGMMLSASFFTLAGKAVHDGRAYEVITGLAAGAALFTWTSRLVDARDWRLATLTADQSRRSILVLITMFVHSIPEGVAIGVGYATGELQFGLLLAIAIAVHNIPEGVAVSLPLRAQGVSVPACAGYAVLTSVPQPVAAVPAFLLVSTFQGLLPVSLGFAGGAMIFLVASELLPESLAHGSRHETAWGVMVGLIGMLALTSSLGL